MTSVNSHGGETPDDNSSQNQQLPEVNDKSKNILRNLIHQQLDEIRTGNAYVEHELQPDCFSKLLVDNDVYSKFELMTARKWMDVDLMANQEIGLNGGKLNKKRKQYVNAIKKVEGFVRTEIEQYTASAADGDAHGHGHAHRGGAEEDTVSSLSESKVSSTSQRRKKKSKKSKKKKMKDKRKAKKSKKRKRDQASDGGSDSDLMDVDSQSASLTDGGNHSKVREDQKARFEEEKRRVLSMIPASVSKQFRTLGFAKWTKDFLPVMFLGPYDVAPGPVRNQWMAMLKNTKKNKTPMSRLVFWYGTVEENFHLGYSFIPTKSILTYEEGCKKGYEKISPRLQKKIDSGKKLTENEVLQVDGLEQMKNDIKLPPEERIQWIFDFEEEYEEIDDTPSVQEEEQVMKKAPVKSKKNKKKKVATNDDDESKHSSKKNKKKRKRDADEKAEENSKKKALNHSKKLDEEIQEEVAQEDEFLQEEAPSEDDDKLDDDFSVENDSESEEEEDDEMYEDKPKKAQGKTKTKRKTNAADSKSKSKVKDVKKSDKPKKVPEPPKKKEKETDRFKEEQLRFEQCEQIFLPLMTKLKVADIEDKQAEKILRKIREDVHMLVPSFIENYNVGIVIKDVRKRYKGTAHLNELCKSITADMKVVYKSKKDSEPLGFQPKIKKKPLKKEKKKQPQTQPIQREKSKINKEQHKVDISHKDKTPISKKQLQVSNSSTLSPKRNENDHSKQEVAFKEFSIPKKSNSDGPNSNAQETETVKIEKTKPASSKKKKPYSLMGMIERPSRQPTSDTGKEGNKETIKEVDRSFNPEAEKLPKWIINYDPIERKATSTNIDREFAMDFLNAAVACLPKEKIDPHSVALALEDALYTQYENDVEKYWERVHYISAAMARKKEMGQLAQKIISGAYVSPKQVIQETTNISWASVFDH
mmetsp:Transcript_5331/g.7911  ORF Transcript_5331/g.7911 Transcript_5331/m.7911 type:complete len:927 (-) Transcript_5331:116-2896(-)|eukprot:CAMPEP_0203669640 /NCGR_PEP_ID=MMETSP0090-20130426/5948_1 /ASSEMBLY_ACC=CAM_ASM_001088 /TAXON_ID=426623 /ORGANISM="Chaetoceros affinis, Strain CCMP159" /LENGTH=926 /DNA_ID=CAMNT_0050534365 /DNA_START=305 /DNA_END=3085 /DNA_ORIENTATION=-